MNFDCSSSVMARKFSRFVSQDEVPVVLVSMSDLSGGDSAAFATAFFGVASLMGAAKY